MEQQQAKRPGQVSGLVLMALVTLWSGGLAIGFVWIIAVGGDEVSTTRSLVYGILAAFMALLSGRTGYELVRRLLGKGYDEPEQSPR